MVAKGKKGQKKARARLVPDGRQLLSSAQASDYLGVPQDTLMHAALRGALTPARYGTRQRGELIYTRADLDRFQSRSHERAIVEALERGEAPITAYLSSAGAIHLRDLARVIHDWARVASYWVVQQPPGSYARWLQRLGLLRVHTTDLRRMIEALCTDDDFARKARLALDAARAARLNADAVRAREASARATSSASDAP